jgi:flagellar biosynthesis protein FliR
VVSINLDVAWLITVGLLSIRMGVLFYATPFDAIGRLPARIRILFSFLAGLFFVSVLDPSLRVNPQNVVELVGMGVHEVLVGLLMAFGLYCAFGSIMVAGKLLDFQAGFGAAQILNPSTNAASPLFGTVLSLFAIVVFFTTDLYQVAIRGIAWSILEAPPGEGVRALSADSIVQQFGLTYVYGIIIAAPVVAMLLLLDTGLAVMGRSMPQMNIYFLFLPLKIGVALVLVALSLRYLTPALERLFIASLRYWQQVVI